MADFAGTLPAAYRSFGGFPAGTTFQSLLPGYGMSQQLNNIGIPGQSQNQLIGGGSWAGTVWNPPGAGSTFKENPIPIPGSGQFYDQYGNPQPLGPDAKGVIRPAFPYQTTWYQQTYGGQAAPWQNIHQQAAASMAGVPPAYPGFAWASPQQLGASLGGGGAPGGWTQMTGYTPGGAQSYLPPPSGPQRAALAAPTAPTVPTGGSTGNTGDGSNWQSFKFSDPSNGFQKDFNALQKIDPSLAWTYATQYGGPAGWNDIKDAFWNTFSPGGNEPGSAQRIGIGITDPNWAAPQYTLDKSGMVNYGGKQYQLPEVTSNMLMQLDPEAWIRQNYKPPVQPNTPWGWGG
jgi:hypothetical protein